MSLTDLSDRVPVGPEFDGFAVFIVGGAVRDELRSQPSADIDIMAVPESVSDPVGVLEQRMDRIDPEDSFPVFVDSGGREVALPRTEESTGQGFHDFDVSLVPPEAPVAEAVRTDLERRDLTVNSMTVNARTGELFDPFGGRQDLRDGVVRHVSEAFCEDPLRVVRLARFAARLDADVAPETVEIARDTAPRLSAVPIERITMEARKTFKQAPDPARFFRVLDDVDALGETFPALAGLPAVQLDDALRHITEVARLSDDSRVCFAGLGAGLDEEARGALIEGQDIHNAEQRAMNQAPTAASTFRCPDRASPRAMITVAERLQRAGGLTAAETVVIMKARAEALSVAFPAGAALKALSKALEAVETIDGQTVMNREGKRPGDGVSGKEFGELIMEHRIDALTE